MQQSVRNVCAKFKVDRLSCFRTGASQVFTTQKPWKLQHQILFKIHFLIKLPSVKFLFKSLTYILDYNKSAYQKTGTRDPSGTLAGPYQNRKTETLAGPYENRKTGTLRKPENEDPSRTLQKLENQDPSGSLRNSENRDPSRTLPKLENRDPTKIGKPGP